VLQNIFYNIIETSSSKTDGFVFVFLGI